MIGPERSFTAEQAEAIDRRDGDLLLDAGAGSGKTTVLVERFARAVLEDGADPAAILTITFTEKAAAELRERIRRRLTEAGDLAAARATEAAPVSTIHGLCARLLRAHALVAGLDPRFSILDRPAARGLADAALDTALQALASHTEGRELIATYGAGTLRTTTLALHGRLRAAGHEHPQLPALPAARDLARAHRRLDGAATLVAAELGALASPGVRVSRALQALQGCGELVTGGGEAPWPAELDAFALGNGSSALSSDACAAYRDALADFRRVCAEHHASTPHRLLGALLEDFGAAYARSKRQEGGVDFEDLELLTLRLLRQRPGLTERLRERFAHVMVDEFQDTNRVQLELIELLCHGNLFTVGDAQQSIYGFRYADVELFRRRSRELEARGRRLTLSTNFRSHPEVLAVIDRAFRGELGEIQMPLRAGRSDGIATSTPRVELLVCEKSPEWEDDGSATPWRVAEARLLARRIAELLHQGAAPRQVVVLLRATSDMRVYERALEDLAIPSYVIGGRGYWGHPQVIDAVAYLRALANPLDGEALLGVLASPFAGLSLDALVILSAGARARGVELGALLDDLSAAHVRVEVEGLAPDDRERLERFSAWFAAERSAAGRVSVEELLDRALASSGYDEAMLRLPGGRRRLANVRKLMRLAREHEAQAGRDLGGFLELVRGREGGWVPDAQESEAPVEGEALDAVRLMTIHRSKGLEFDITCVADLGRAPWSYPEVVRVGDGGRIGLAVARLGEHGREPAFAYAALGEEAAAAEAREERRLFYVAATRARERLILSGAARWEPWKTSGSAMGWLAPALLAAGSEEGETMADLIAAGAGERSGVAFRFLSAGEEEAADGERLGKRDVSRPRLDCSRDAWSPARAPEGLEGAHDPLLAPAAPTVSRLSYSTLGEYHRCGYRFYAERVLGLPPLEPLPPAGASAGAAARRLTATERGTVLHALLERMDFRRPLLPTPEEIQRLAPRRLAPAELGGIGELLERFAASTLCRRLAGVREVRREERFAFRLGEVLYTGAFDVLARERDGTLLVLDYKSDRLEGTQPSELVAERYAIQQLVYGLAALRAGAQRAEIVHVFLERPEQPVLASRPASRLEGLERELEQLTAGIRSGRYEVTLEPRREICAGCPAEGSLCSWPLAMTRRSARAGEVTL